MTLGPTIGGVGFTRRGWATLGIAVAGLLLASEFGPRSLNAVVLPALVALGAAVVIVRRVEPPTVRRDMPPDGFPDGGGTVTLSFDTDRPFTGRVADALSPGLDGEALFEAAVGVDPVSYEVRYRRRGEHELGPAEFVARDVLGLAERSFVAGGVDRVLVYPPLAELTGRARRDLLGVYESERIDGRDEFDRIRPYERGDPLRDVHWKSSAKRGELLVREFISAAEEGAVRVAATAAPGRADAMAEAAGSLCLLFLDAGVPVTLATPLGVVEADPRERRAVLEHLARVDDGAGTERDADVHVEATPDGVRVEFAGVDCSFAELVADGRPADARVRAGDAPAAVADGGETGDEPTGERGQIRDERGRDGRGGVRA